MPRSAFVAKSFRAFRKRQKRKNATRTVTEGRVPYGVSLRRTLLVPSYASREKKTVDVSARHFRYARRTRVLSRLAPPRFARRPPSSRPEASERVRLAFVVIKKTVNTTNDRDLRSRTRCPARKTGATPLIASFSSLSRRRRRELSLPRVRLATLVSSPPRRVLFTIQIHAT